MDSQSTFYVPHWYNTLPVDDSHPWLGCIVRSHQVPVSSFIPDSPFDTVACPRKIFGCDNWGNVEFDFKAPPQSQPAPTSTFRRFFCAPPPQKSGYIHAANVTRYYLTNEQEVFAMIIADKHRKKRIEGWCRWFKPAYMIVGYLVTDDAQFQDRDYTYDYNGQVIIAFEFKVVKRTLREACGGIKLQEYGVKGDRVFVEDVGGNRVKDRERRRRHSKGDDAQIIETILIQQQ